MLKRLFKSETNVRPWLVAVAGGLLQAAAFPPFEWSGAAWVGPAVLMLALPGREPRHQFMLGWVSGAVFWLISIHWLIRVTAAGWVALSLYCALYTGLFALLTGWALNRQTGSVLGRLGVPAMAAISWTGLEYIRSNLFTGFPWNPLGVSQTGNLVLIQHASWGGVYAVSFIIVWVNAALALLLLCRFDPNRRACPFRRLELTAGLFVLVLALFSGHRMLLEPDPPAESFRAVLVQTDIPQDDKWDIEKIEMIYGRLRELTGLARYAGAADLIVWPETALPDDVRNSEPSYALVSELANANRTPILVGSMDTEWRDEGPVYFNSSFLFDRWGRIVEVYDKQHLVLLGEYLPFNGVLSFINALTPIEASFTPGTTSTVFRLEKPAVAFSVLICFEDTVAALARSAVRNGARLLINQTNDAWFDPFCASRQHMLHGVFRSVENRVPTLRAANSGISCRIDRKGRVREILQDADGRTRFAGFKSVTVEVPVAPLAPTWYTRHGDRPAEGCAIATAVALAALLWTRRREKLWRESF